MDDEGSVRVHQTVSDSEGHHHTSGWSVALHNNHHTHCCQDLEDSAIGHNAHNGFHGRR